MQWVVLWPPGETKCPLWQTGHQRTTNFNYDGRRGSPTFSYPYNKGCWPEIVVLHNILSLSSKPPDLITFWIIWWVLSSQHSILHDLFTWKKSRRSNNCGTHCILSYQISIWSKNIRIFGHSLDWRNIPSCNKTGNNVCYPCKAYLYSLYQNASCSHYRKWYM